MCLSQAKLCKPRDVLTALPALFIDSGKNKHYACLG